MQRCVDGRVAFGMVDPEEEGIMTFETSGPTLPTTQSHLP